MNKIAKFFGIAAVIFAAAACTNVEYKEYPYITLVTNSINVNENVGTVDLVLASHNLGSNTATATLEIVNGTAVNGTNISLASPTVTFNGDEQKTVSVSIVDNSGVYTGSLTCSIKLSGASEGVEIGSFNEASVIIKDLDHPLAVFIGDWAGKGFSEYDEVYYAWEFSITSVDSDVNKLKLVGFDPGTGAGAFEVTINETKDGFIIPDGIGTGATYSSYGQVSLRGLNGPTGAESTGYADIEVKLVDGNLFIPNAIISRVSAGILERYSGNVTFTKK